jgi:hypothetical protein
MIRRPQGVLPPDVLEQLPKEGEPGQKLTRRVNPRRKGRTRDTADILKEVENARQK